MTYITPYSFTIYSDDSNSKLWENFVRTSLNKHFNNGGVFYHWDIVRDNILFDKYNAHIIGDRLYFETSQNMLMFLLQWS